MIPIYLVSLTFFLMFMFAPPKFLGGYFNSCNAIDNQNRIRKSDLALNKYWVTQSGYFRLVTTVTLGVGITDVKLL